MKSGRPLVLISVQGTRRAPARKGLQATRIKAGQAVRPGVGANLELQVTGQDLDLLAGPGVDLYGLALHPGQEVTPEAVAGDATDRGHGAGLTAAIGVIGPTAEAAQEVSLTIVTAEDPGADPTPMTAMTVAAGAEAPPTTDRATTTAGPGVVGHRTAAAITVPAIAGVTVGGVKRLFVLLYLCYLCDTHSIGGSRVYFLFSILTVKIVAGSHPKLRSVYITVSEGVL